MDFFYNLSPVMQALIATCFTWLLTALGAAPVFFVRKVNRNFFNGMLGLAAGVMIAASFWSLLAPAIELSDGAWHQAAIGFLMGGAFLLLIDKILPHLHQGLKTEDAEGISTTWRRSTLLILAITLHNFPEGLAVGVAFGAAAHGLEGATVASAIALALGIGIQNMPEGMAVSMPLRREGFKPLKAFWYGQLSGMAEPIAGVLGALAVITMRTILPYALSFAAGAMIFVVAEELIPEAQREGSTDIPTIGVMLGFAIMMTLDVALG